LGWFTANALALGTLERLKEGEVIVPALWLLEVDDDALRQVVAQCQVATP
jgi:hypothetical protein